MHFMLWFGSFGITQSLGYWQVFMKFCKHLLGVELNYNNAMVYIESGCLPLRFVRIRFKLLRTTNCILKSYYANLTIDCKAKRLCSNLAAFFRLDLYNIGLYYYVNTKNTLCSINIFQLQRKQ